MYQKCWQLLGTTSIQVRLNTSMNTDKDSKMDNSYGFELDLDNYTQVGETRFLRLKLIKKLLIDLSKTLNCLKTSVLRKIEL